MKLLIGLFFILGVTGCSPQTTSTPPAVSSPASTDAPSSVEPPADTSVDHGIVIEDVGLIVGGSLSPAHVGPAKYETVMARFRAAPLVYLAEANSQALAAPPHDLSNFHFESLVFMVAERHPDEASSAARQLLPKYRSARVVAVSEPQWDAEVRVLDRKIQALEEMAARR